MPFTRPTDTTGRHRRRSAGGNGVDRRADETRCCSLTPPAAIDTPGDSQCLCAVRARARDHDQVTRDRERSRRCAQRTRPGCIVRPGCVRFRAGQSISAKIVIDKGDHSRSRIRVRSKMRCLAVSADIMSWALPMIRSSVGLRALLVRQIAWRRAVSRRQASSSGCSRCCHGDPGIRHLASSGSINVR